MPKTLLLATRNAHKKREISELLAGEEIEVVGLDAFPELPETVEDRATLEGNAEKKALEAARGARLWALADDTGLAVAALDGRPGVYSARYAGPGCDFAANNAQLLGELSQISATRRAAFRTVMALCSPDGEISLAEGRLEGEIVDSQRGKNGFGYDPVFFVPEAGRTLAELSDAEKNSLSHRSRALANILPHIRRCLLAVLCALCVLCGLPSPSFAGRTEPGQETIWDQIMAAQSHRGLRQGSRHLDAKQYDMALREFERAVAANPNDALAHTMLGVARYWTGQVDASVESYRRAIELDPRNAQAYLLLGISRAYRAELKEARAAFLKAAEFEPTRADVQMNLGSIEDSLGNIQDALTRFRTAVSLAPKEPLYHFQLGMLYRKLGRDPDAADSLREALRNYRGFEDALLELGAIEERSGERKDAISSFKKAVDIKSKDSVATFRLGRLHLLTGDQKRAREVFSEAFHLTPEEGGGGLQLSVSYAPGKKKGPPSDKKNPQQPQPTPTPEDQANDPLAVFERNLERIPLEQSAILQVDVVSVPKPKLVKETPEGRGGALAGALKREMGSERTAPKASRREYRIPAAGDDARAGQITRILDDLRALMKESPEDSDVRLGMNLAFTRLADARAGEPPTDARVSYQPRQVGNDMGLWIIGTGWMSLVEEVLPEPGEAPPHPDQSDWWVATGLGYATLGDGQKALSAFERAVALDPSNPAAWLGKGVASVMTGNETAAVAAYKEALKLSPKNKPAAEGLKWLLRPSSKKKNAQNG